MQVYYFSSELVFAVGPNFVHEYRGNLNGCVVMLMGCESMDDTRLAKEMVSRGTSAMVGWRGTMSINESNGVTLRLLEALVSGSSVGEAVILADGEFGLGGRLVFHPIKAHWFS